jgi:hypothetical protein
MNPRNFFAELKRRNVYKVAVAYAIVSWLLIQAASILFPTFDAPQWVMKVFVAVVVLGFPIALILAWAFEVTPEGIKRAEDVAPNEKSTHEKSQKQLKAPRSAKFWKLAVPPLLVCFLVTGGLYYYRSVRSKPLTDKDSVLLADFSNSTGDPVFDGTLRQGLASQLEQSPF